MPGCGHAQIWLAYGYLQQGRINNARRTVEACGDELRSRPTMTSGADLLAAEGSSAASFHAMRARHLIDSGEWTGSLASVDECAGELPLAEFSCDFVAAYGALRFGKGKVAGDVVARAEKSAARLVAAVLDVGTPAGHPQQLIPKIELDELRGLALLRQGDAGRAVELLAKAAAAERTLPMDYGPPSLHKPANELLGEVLLELGRAKEARTAFESAQVVAPGRTQSLLGLVQSAKKLGDAGLAESAAAKLQQTRMNAAPDGA